MVKTNVVNGKNLFAVTIVDDYNETKCAVVAQNQNGVFKASVALYNQIPAHVKPVVELAKSYTNIPTNEALADVYLATSFAVTEHVENTCFGKDVKRQQHEVFDVLTNALYDVLYAN